MIPWPARNDWLSNLEEIEGKRPAEIAAVASVKNPKDRALIFASDCSEEVISLLSGCRDSLLVLPEAKRASCKELGTQNGVIYCTDPRYRFAEILNSVFRVADLRGVMHWDSRREIVLGENVTIDLGATIEPGATIASHCVIEAGAYIMSGARIGPGVQIGPRSVIRENCVVGGWGFGYALAKGKPPLRLPHLGGVVIGSDCEVGSFTTICSGTIEPTVLENHVKVDDHCHIAHNVHLEEGAMVIACAEVSGSVRVGKRSWLGPNCSIIDRITIGADCVVGLGAVVRKSLPDGVTVAGNPAKPTDELRRDSERLRRLDDLLSR